MNTNRVGLQSLFATNFLVKFTLRIIEFTHSSVRLTRIYSGRCVRLMLINDRCGNHMQASVQIFSIPCKHSCVCVCCEAASALLQTVLATNYGNLCIFVQIFAYTVYINT